MIKRVYLRLFIITLIAALAVLPLFSSCKANDSTTLEINPSKTVEETAVKETEEEPKPADTVIEEAEEEPAQEELQVEEEDVSETVQEEDASQPVQIMDISPAEVFEIMENDEDYMIVDVRTKEEYDSGHLEGAILFPVQELLDRLDELPTNKPIIVYCRSGARSRSAAETLVANGFTMVYDMGGISDWIEEGYPVILEE
jgi:rhodanese-related sulfurtransferase